MRGLTRRNAMKPQSTQNVQAHSALASLAVQPLRRPATQRTVAITYGTYDLIHVGHVRLWQRIKERFDVLIVAVSTDEFNAIKGKRSAVPYADRVEMVLACRYVDQVIPEQTWEQKAHDIAQHNVDAFVMGSDWEGRFDELKPLCEVVYLPRTEGISSTEIKTTIRG
ncbi:MAG: glycerol-3-phosphate cytidiltransferase [Rhizobacter sp.]|jgi:glycerol-3-phosphate cytidylyltransferase|nr:glycerol-3-phosphate cytidiltransferase [Rhizobacter sp.]